MHTSIPSLSLLASVTLASLASAQYEEPSVAVLFEQSIGPAAHLFGWAAVGLGDANGDGVLDLAAAAPFSPGRFGASSAGRVFALSGADGSTLWSRDESRQSAILGYSLEVLDWNGDGVLDVVAGAPFATIGRTWIYSGVDGATLAELLGPAQGSGFGASVATGGDFDGDGVEDLAVGAPFLSNTIGTMVGGVYLFTRGSTTPFAEIAGQALGGELGLGLAFVGDSSLPADGRDEIVVGSRDPASFFDGFASVFTWNGSQVVPGVTVSGVGMSFDLLGDRIDGGGDANGDGVPDFLVGDLFHSEVELFSGADGALLHTLSASGDLGAAHFLSDVDGDGRADVVVGAWQDQSGAPDGGRVYVFSGASGALLKTITSTTTEQNLGIDARELGDFNGDGRPDLVVGAYGDGFGGPLAGAALVFSGHLPGSPNQSFPAELPGDPLLFDAGGDRTAGPLVGTPLEPFDLGLNCQNAPMAGPWSIQVRPRRHPTPLLTSQGLQWIRGGLIYSCAGMQSQNVVFCALGPGGIVLPNQPVLIGLSFTAQGLCGGRLSNALTQTIGR